MSINGIFNAGVKGLAASQLATQVTANNIANAATAGYTRRSASVLPDQSLIGGSNARRVNEPFIERRLLNAQTSNGEAQAERLAVDVLDKVFAEGDGSVGDALDQFQVAMQNLAARPEDPATRQQVLTSTNAVSNAFQNAAAQLRSARNDANSRVVASVSEVNQRLEQIGRLSTEIQQSEVNGVEASDLRDQRDLLIKEVAERVPVTVMDHGNGQMSVLLAGSQSLVSPEGKVSALSAVVGDDGSIRVEKVAAGARVDVTGLVSSGVIGGAIKASQGPLAEAEKRLDQLAYDVATKYNEVHAAGYGLDGVSGRNLFEPLDGVDGAAAALMVSSDVAGVPENIGAATDENALPSDNRNALALAALASAPFASGGSLTVTEALASLVGYAGGVVQNAEQAATFATGALEQVQSMHDNVSGVSTDEEMIAMMKYQRAYEASLKVLQAADEMLSDLLNIR